MQEADDDSCNSIDLDQFEGIDEKKEIEIVQKPLFNLLRKSFIDKHKELKELHDCEGLEEEEKHENNLENQSFD